MPRLAKAADSAAPPSLPDRVESLLVGDLLLSRETLLWDANGDENLVSAHSRGEEVDEEVSG